MPSPIVAPCARAAAQVDRNGTLARTKNVTGVRKVATGDYDVTVSADIDVTTAMCQVTADRGAHWGTEVYVGATSSTTPNVVKVLTSVKGSSSDEPFHLAVL
ncbi:hypothetical protein [Streptomyces sp. NPDC006285]|jgi:hypothetical protein|uniref:hypothetical protein n=1 Tax=Streptomyces sp. NPDC006285 TaxID=3364742 RepID=UPI0036B2D83F